MGDRANYIWKENEVTTIYYAGFGAHDTTNVLAQGLDFCREYFPNLSERDFFLHPDEWIGTLLIDVDKKHIIVFSCDDLPPTLKNYYLEKVKPIWPDWTINYTNYGPEDVLTHLNTSLDYLDEMCDYSFDDINRDSELPSYIITELDYMDLTTIRRNGKINHYQLGHVPSTELALSKGEDAYKWFNEKHKVKSWIKERDCYATLLIDYDSKSIFVNWAYTVSKCAVKVIQNVWPGWKITRHQEGMIFNFKYLNLDYSHLVYTLQDFEQEYQEFCMGKQHIRYLKTTETVVKLPQENLDDYSGVSISFGIDENGKFDINIKDSK